MPVQHILDGRMDTTMKMILMMNLNQLRAKCIGNTRYMQCPCNIFIYYEQVAVTLPEDGRPRNSTQRGLNMAQDAFAMASRRGRLAANAIKLGPS